MATNTLGSNANNSLTALTFQPGYGSGMATADVATIAQLIKGDQGNAHAVWREAFSYNGILYLPNRGQIKILPGDVVAVDTATGWPILVSKRAIAAGPWHFV